MSISNDNNSCSDDSVSEEPNRRRSSASFTFRTHPSSVSSRLMNDVQQFRNGLSMSGGDIGSTVQLFFDNLSTILGALFAIQSLSDIGGVSRTLMDDIVFQKIVPGVGLTLLLGNFYYSWQAIRLTNKYGRQYTAQPYGVSAMLSFSFVYNIIYPVFFQKMHTAPSIDEAFYNAYQTALRANFITGLVSVTLGMFGPLILRIIPPAALLVPIAGIGIAFLGLEQLSYAFSAPMVGFPCVLWVFIGWYAGVRIRFGKYFYIPEALMIILVGVSLGWITGLNGSQAVLESSTQVQWVGPHFIAVDEIFTNFHEVTEYLDMIIPLGISAMAQSLMCLVSAKEAGDPFPIRETLIMDGIGTMLGSFFGSPFGTTIYVGHPAYKRSGAKVGYSLLNGSMYLLLSWVGFLALMQTIVNTATIGPIVFFVGLMINEEALNFIPTRHQAAYIIGLFPSIYDWVVNISGRSPLQDVENGTYLNTNLPPGSDSWYGILAFKRGSLLISLLWTSICVLVIDRRWKTAAVWCLIAALFSAVGIIHVPVAGFSSFTSPTWEQCDYQTETCWEYGEQWMFTVGYIILALTVLFIEVLRKFDLTIEPAMQDQSTRAFDDWFANAAIDRKECRCVACRQLRGSKNNVHHTYSNNADGFPEQCKNKRNVEPAEQFHPSHRLYYEHNNYHIRDHHDNIRCSNSSIDVGRQGSNSQLEQEYPNLLCHPIVVKNSLENNSLDGSNIMSRRSSGRSNARTTDDNGTVTPTDDEDVEIGRMFNSVIIEKEHVDDGGDGGVDEMREVSDTDDQHETKSAVVEDDVAAIPEPELSQHDADRT